ncbi:hypothetical protein PRNP1_006828 [Phytophthora ramorum]
METWLTDPNELRRIERRSQKRSRDRMRTLKEWYVPATSGPAEEVQPGFVAAMNQSNQEHSTRNKVGKPLLSKEAAALKDEEDREALEAVLQRKVAAFTTKLEYLEQLADPTPTRAKIRAGLPRRRRRVAREDMLLAPLGPARSNSQAAKSVANLPSHFDASSSETKLRVSTSVQTFRPLSRLHADSEDAEDALDDAEVEHYLLHHRKVAKQGYAAVKLQATWRMHIRPEEWQFRGSLQDLSLGSTSRSKFSLGRAQSMGVSQHFLDTRGRTICEPHSSTLPHRFSGSCVLGLFL